jgi:hypothetical protein
MIVPLIVRHLNGGERLCPQRRDGENPNHFSGLADVAPSHPEVAVTFISYN